MANWTQNTIMVWRPKLPGDTGNVGDGHPYEDGWKVSDHGRAALDISDNPILTDSRTANGTLRRHYIRSPKKFGLSWENLPGKNGLYEPGGTYLVPDPENPGEFLTVTNNNYQGHTFVNSSGMHTADGGMCVEEMAMFWRQNRGSFLMGMRRGSASGKPWPDVTTIPYDDDDFYITNVMITEFSINLNKRGINDLYNVSITLEEVW